MSNNTRNKNIFAGFVGHFISFSEIQNALCEQNESLCGRKWFPNLLPLGDNGAIGQLINTEFEQTTLPHIYSENDFTLSQFHSMVPLITITQSSKNKRNTITYAADYDYEELRDIAINCKDFETGDVEEIDYSLYGAHNASFHDFVPQIMDKYKDNWFEYLQSLNLNVTYLFYDKNSNSLSALKIGNASNLYFGHAKLTDEIFISNNPEIVQKFCYDIFEVDYDCYYKNGEFYNVDKNKNAPTFIKRR